MTHIALIFDLDGTLSDTQKHHSAIEALLLWEYGVTITPEDIMRRFSGVNTVEFCTTLLMQHAGMTADIARETAQAVATEKWIRLQDPTILGSMQCIEGAYPLLEMLHRQRVPMAIGSASTRKYCETVLNHLHLRRFVAHVVGGDEIAQGKPAPDIFLRAMTLLDTHPEHCVVVGDSVHDFHAAHNAGMHCIAYRPNGKLHEECLHGAYTVQHLSEITQRLLVSLMSHI